MDVAALSWGAVAAVVGIALMQSLHMLAPSQDTPTVDLMGIGADAESGSHTDDADDTRPSEEHSRPNLFGTILAAAAIPSVAAFVAVRIAILYVGPTLVVAAAVAMTSPVDWTAAGLAWLGSVLVSLVNEFVVVRPIARRCHVSLD